MNINTCYHCKSTNHSFYAEENGYTLLKCSGCGLLFLHERPEDDQISAAHQQGKHKGINELDVTGTFSTPKIAVYMKILEKIYQGNISKLKTWLDVGCGHGEFMSALNEYSYNSIKCKGTEPNIGKQQSARDHGLDVSFFELEKHTDTYDCISLLNVYSHLPNPPEFIATLKKLLNPHGELLIETGDTANFSAKEHYRPFYLPDHLSFASEKILVDMLESAGFQIISIEKYPYIDKSIKTFLKEIVKLALPNYHSKLKYYILAKKYQKTDMFIRAKLR